jgi:tRNA A-37 threonylcarbamoyl transferase component Bud32
LNNKSVALKFLDLWQHPALGHELINEIKVYRTLKQLQGKCIPRFEKAGYVPGGLLIIATEIVGAPLEDVASVSKEECLAIERVLASIHSYGYIHGDVRKDNILVKRSGEHFNAFFIDFAFARRGSQAEFYGEKRVLAQLLGSYFLMWRRGDRGRVMFWNRMTSIPNLTT